MGMFVIGMVMLVVGTLLVFLPRMRYRAPGQAPDVRNVEEFGAPVKSLYTSTALLTLHHRIEVTDDNDKVVYRAETQFPSIHDKTDIYSADDRHIAHIERKLISLHEVHYVDMDNGKSFTLSNELLHLIKDVTNIEGLGWVLKGNILQLNFTIKDTAGQLIAVVSQKMISLHDKYAVDIYKPDYEEEVVAILITLQHMISDRAAAAASSGGASS